MPFLTSNSWFEVTFVPLAKGPWKDLSYAPTMSTMTLSSLIKNEPLVLYVDDAASGVARGMGGESSNLDGSLVQTAVPLASVEITDKASAPLRMAKDKAGNLYVLDEATSLVRRFDVAEAVALKAFL